MCNVYLLKLRETPPERVKSLVWWNCAYSQAPRTNIPPSWVWAAYVWVAWLDIGWRSRVQSLLQALKGSKSKWMERLISWVKFQGAHRPKCRSTLYANTSKGWEVVQRQKRRRMRGGGWPRISGGSVPCPPPLLLSLLTCFTTRLFPKIWDK